MADLGTTVTAATADDTGVRTGVVTSLTPLIVSLQGGVVNSPGALRPNINIGDTVALLRQGDSWLCLGSTGSSTGSSSGTSANFQARQILTASVASVTFSNIPTNLRNLQLRWKARSDTAALLTTVAFQVNGNAGPNYSNEDIQANGAVVAAGAGAGTTSSFIGRAGAATSPAGLFGSGLVDFQSWDLPANFLTWTYGSGVQTSGGFLDYGAGNCGVPGPWTSITILPGAGLWIAGCDFQLYGIGS